MTLHVGLGLRYSRINTGRVVDDDAFKTEVTIESAMETYVDATTKFLNADVAWAKNILDLNPELLFKTDRLFVRGEYLYKRLYKDRPDFDYSPINWEEYGVGRRWMPGKPVTRSAVPNSTVVM